MAIYLVFYILESIGILSFFISGALLAKHKNFDPIGIYIIGFVTALGGGTLRDIILDRSPVYWIQHSEYPLLFILLTVGIYLLNLPEQNKPLILTDTIGIGTFCITSTQLGVEAELPIIIIAIIAVISTCFGGLLRDLLCSQTPYVFQKESFYATIVFIGSLSYVGLNFLSISVGLISFLTLCIVILVRLLSIRYNWRFK